MELVRFLCVFPSLRIRFIAFCNLLCVDSLWFYVFGAHAPQSFSTIFHRSPNISTVRSLSSHPPSLSLSFALFFSVFFAWHSSYLPSPALLIAFLFPQFPLQWSNNCLRLFTCVRAHPYSSTQNKPVPSPFHSLSLYWHLSKAIHFTKSHGQNNVNVI